MPTPGSKTTKQSSRLVSHPSRMSQVSTWDALPRRHPLAAPVLGLEAAASISVALSTGAEVIWGHARAIEYASDPYFWLHIRIPSSGGAVASQSSSASRRQAPRPCLEHPAQDSSRPSRGSGAFPVNHRQFFNNSCCFYTRTSPERSSETRVFEFARGFALFESRRVQTTVYRSHSHSSTILNSFDSSDSE